MRSTASIKKTKNPIPFLNTSHSLVNMCKSLVLRCTKHGSWVISHVPIFHITQPLDSIRYMVNQMATFSGDVQYSQVMGHLPTPVV